MTKKDPEFELIQGKFLNGIGRNCSKVYHDFIQCNIEVTLLSYSMESGANNNDSKAWQSRSPVIQANKFTANIIKSIRKSILLLRLKPILESKHLTPNH